MRLRNIPFRIESAVVHSLYKAARLRLGSAPFISGDTFRGIADHVMEKGRSLDPEKVRKGDVVFVEAGELGTFAKSCLPFIPSPFVLITHNGDVNIDESHRYIVEDGRIARWFAQDCLLAHPKITAIPIGLENRLLHYNGVIRDYKKLAARRSRKLARILYGFTLKTNKKERREALAALRDSPLADAFNRTNSRHYRNELERYAFVASPPGNGVDCHRTWEALYLRVVPIVKKSTLYESFPGLPVLAIEDWAEIRDWNSDFLSKTYDELSPLIESTPYLRFDYWLALIQNARSKLQDGGI